MSTPITIIKSDIRSVLTFISPYLSTAPCIVEAGAFRGDGTLFMSEWWPQATIHAFEPVPELFAQLNSSVAGKGQVRTYPYALGEAEGERTFYVGEKRRYPGVASQSGSLLKPKDRLNWTSFMVYPRTVNVPVVTLDAWARQHGVSHIDLFWLDVQGYAFNVLKHARDILQSTRLIYTEVEFVEAYEQQHCYEEVKTWLEELGFVMIARDFKEQQSWFFGNVVFMNKAFMKE